VQHPWSITLEDDRGFRNFHSATYWLGNSLGSLAVPNSDRKNLIMAKTSQAYYKIAGVGAGRGLFNFSRRYLYASIDHLLIIESTGYTEDYRRVQYQDIQALVARPTAARLIRNLVFLPFFALSALGCLSSNTKLIVLGWLGVVAFGLFVVFNSIRGQACQCEITTRVQTLRLPAVNHMGKFHKLVAHIKDKLGQVPDTV
jgi:hypothetical protein